MRQLFPRFFVCWYTVFTIFEPVAVADQLCVDIDKNNVRFLRIDGDYVKELFDQAFFNMRNINDHIAIDPLLPLNNVFSDVVINADCSVSFKDMNLNKFAFFGKNTLFTGATKFDDTTIAVDEVIIEKDTAFFAKNINIHASVYV